VSVGTRNIVMFLPGFASGSVTTITMMKAAVLALEEKNL
jgi:hypothetical protein